MEPILESAHTAWSQPCIGPCSGYGSHACCPPRIVLAVAAVERPASLATSTCLISLRKAAPSASTH